MRRFANLYIVLFLLDALLSLTDELLAVAGLSVPVLSDGRYGLAYAVILLSVAIFASLGIDRRLPKGVFLPLTLYVFWSTLALWPVAAVVGRESLGLVAAAGQLLLVGGLVMGRLRRRGGQVLLAAGQLQGVVFGWRNTLGFIAVNLLLLPFFTVYTGLAVAAYHLEGQTAGFLRLSPLGVYMSERSYQRGDQRVRLAGMMHIGREDYYRDLAGSMASGGTIILTEGVTDRDRRLSGQFNYGKLAALIGVTTQQTMHLDGNHIDLAELNELAVQRGGPDRPDIARADIDLNRFDAQTIEFLNVLGTTLFSGRPLAEALADYQRWVNEKMTAERLSTVMGDILDKRNAVVIDGLLSSLEHYDTVVIPWGAMHMPAIEAAVLAQGFEPAARQERLSLDFRAIPYRELWRKWSAPREGLP